jgi:hypothetical protein
MLATIMFRVLSQCLLSENLDIKIYKIKILPLVIYGCETWSLTLGEEQRLGASENRVLREYLDLRGRMWRRLEKTT